MREKGEGERERESKNCCNNKFTMQNFSVKGEMIKDDGYSKLLLQRHKNFILTCYNYACTNKK